MTSKFFRYPITGAAWNRVPAIHRAVEPYNRICEIVAERPGYGSKVGTGWYHERGSILTAAHVIHGADQVKVRFANETQWRTATGVEITPGYLDRAGEPRECSPKDLGRISIDLGANGPIYQNITFARIANRVGYCVIGFVKEELVEHVGSGEEIDDFIAYNAHTSSGHSGSPVFLRGRLVGIHVGAFNASMKFMTSFRGNDAAYLNSAVRIA